MVKKWGFIIWLTNFEVQKIDHIILKIYKIVVIAFFIIDKVNKKKFFEKSFLGADISSEIVLKLLFLTMSIVLI